jgi:hypothetical protein
MIRPDKQPIDSVPRDLAPDLDPRTTPAQKLRRPRSALKRDAMVALAAAVIGALGKKAVDRDGKAAESESDSR